MARVTRRLTLLRHAKSSWSDPACDDIDRPLNARGKRDAPEMGERLRQRGARPSLILTSPAKRARQTARLVARAIGYPIEFLQREDELYLATPETIIAVLARQDASFHDVVICGHNPGLTELASQLTGIAIDNVPTCGIVAMQTSLEDWSGLGNTHCKLLYFDYPKARGESDRE